MAESIPQRRRSHGLLEVYRNGVLLATHDVTGWPYSAEGGYLGLWFIYAEDAVLDDFGGGTSASAHLPLPLSRKHFLIPDP